MTQALWAVLLMSLAQGAQPADTRPVAQISTVTSTDSRAAPTQMLTRAPVARPHPTATAPNDRFARDMAQCRSLPGAVRAGCEREMHAARAQGLYRD